jgi:GNAT superfamily N-acetyltransferase
MSTETAPFAPGLASPEELRAWYDIFREIAVSDFPDASVPQYDVYVRQLCGSVPQHAVHERWDARRNGRVLGTASAVFPTDDNRERVVLAVRVPAQDRGAGVGTRLLRAALPRIREHGCRWIASQVREGADGEQWANTLGFRQVLRCSSHRLDIRGVDPSRWRIDPPTGFTFRQWTDTAPEDLLGGFARARNAMADQPIGGSSYRHPPWTAERVRRYEAGTLASGESHRYVAAVDERSGTVAGFTELAVVPGQVSHCRQEDTAVLPEFRGLGLGRAMKALMMRWLTTEHPRIEQVRTMTAAENAHMIRVNAQLGYTTDHTLITVESEVAAVEALLNPSR